MPLKLWRIYFLKINSMVEGKFQSDKDSSPTPVVPALIGWNGGVQTPFFILDTGFSGELSVTEQMGKDLGLNFDTVQKMKTANGETVSFPIATAYAQMEGEKIYVTVVQTKGKPLLGISFMEKFKYVAIVDCKNKTVRLEVAK
jgi:clan AA aspartic protease